MGDRVDDGHALLRNPIYASVVALSLSGAALVADSADAAETIGEADQTGSQVPPDQLETVVVTAERREADVQSVPAAVVVLQGQNLRSDGRISVQQMLEDVPNMTVGVLASPIQSPDNPNQNISIRGIMAAPFHFDNGSRLTPWAEARYEGSYDLIELTEAQYAQFSAYDHQASYALLYAGVGWTSPEGNFTMTPYGRYLLGKQVKSQISLIGNALSVVPGEPRVYGVSVDAHF